MKKHIIIFTYEIGISKPDTHPVENELDRKIRSELGLSEMDSYSILHTSQSQTTSNDNSNAMIIISMVIEADA